MILLFIQLLLMCSLYGTDNTLAHQAMRQRNKNTQDLLRERRLQLNLENNDLGDEDEITCTLCLAGVIPIASGAAITTWLAPDTSDWEPLDVAYIGAFACMPFSIALMKFFAHN